MNKNKIIACLLWPLVVSTSSILADQKYPASDFQPEVVYQDKDYIAKSSAASVESAPVSEADSKYPAANFQPKVIFSDDTYKHSEPASMPAAAQAVSKEVEVNMDKPIASESVGITDAKEEGGSYNMYLLLGLLAIVGGFIIYSNKLKKGTTERQATSANRTANVGQQLTGVARYLNKVSGTGVSRYIEKQVKSPSVRTGVERYVAKQVSAGKKPTSQAALTGVEKYMRDRG